ncbi:MAG: SMP-30/gluconolactonase/LRE family protein [Aeromicrobium sp.]
MTQAPQFEFTAHGVTRPEGIAEAPDGSIWVSDKAGAAAQVAPDGSIRPVGSAGGEPNSLNFLPDGRLLIANFEGTLQVLETGTGAVEPLITEVDGVSITHANYALADANGYIWATESTRFPHPGPDAIPQMLADLDGWLFLRRPDGSSEILAEGLAFANGLALSPDGRFLFVAETFNGRISRAEILPGGGTGPLEEYVTLPLDGLEEKAMVAGPDGMAFDESGALWVGVYNRNALYVIGPDGNDVQVHAYDPATVDLGWPTNPVFTGPDRRDLLVGSIANTKIARARVEVPGAPQPYRITTPAGR